MHAIIPANLNFLDFFHPPATFFIINLNILLKTLFLRYPQSIFFFRYRNYFTYNFLSILDHKFSWLEFKILTSTFRYEPCLPHYTSNLKMATAVFVKTLTPNIQCDSCPKVEVIHFLSSPHLFIFP